MHGQYLNYFNLKVLIRKLRSANNLETRQYHKAAKALLVLIPLFGITYLLVLAGPSDDGLPRHLFAILRAFMLSTQVSTLNYLMEILENDKQKILILIN